MIGLSLQRIKPVLAYLVIVFSAATGGETQTFVTAPEITPYVIPLTGPLAQDDAEISGLAWCNHRLILLPQYTDFYQENQHYVYALEKNTLLQYVHALQSDAPLPPLEPTVLKVKGMDKLEAVAGYQGLEAIACDGNAAYLAAELNPWGAREASAVARAEWQGDVLIVKAVGQTIRSAYKMANMANEALVVADDSVLSLSEVNFVQNKKQPQAHRLSPDLKLLPAVPFSDFPYRLTDATALDEQGRFWVSNYLYRGDQHLRRPTDPFWQQYGQAPTHRQGEVMERLVELQWQDNRIKLTGTAPINIQLTEGTGRNWEGIARLNNLGFLLATDKYPQTILAFIPSPGAIDSGDKNVEL